MPVIKYDDPKEAIEAIAHFVRYTFPRVPTVINDRQVLWPDCKKDTLTAEVDNLPRAGMHKVLSEGLKLCIEQLVDDEPAGLRTHLPVKGVKIKARHIEIILDRSKVGKGNFE